ncbi:MAG: DUF447 family protein, partial [Methanocalculus sp.]|uniref:DUF447 domain-containing protein n=1 Tax=Methanocalculus sp. TaxID=2004547 RepID=UPI00272778AE
NLIYDPVIYVGTAFGDLSFDAFVSLMADGMEMHRLKSAEAWIAFRAEVIGESGEAYSIALTPLKEEVVVDAIHPVNRGFNAIIEAAVHATRFIMTGDKELEWLIRHHLLLARKCGGEREREAAGMIEQVIQQKES